VDDLLLPGTKCIESEEVAEWAGEISQAGEYR